MKTNTNTHHIAAVRMACRFSLAALAVLACACQDYEYGFEETEIRQTAINREYAKEFIKAFPSVDPNHTWMCEPDTI